MEPSSDQDPKGRRKSPGGIVRRPPEDSIDQEAVLAEARTKAQSKFQSRPDQRLDKTAKSPARSKKKAGKGVKAICENLLGNFRRKNSNSGSTTTVTTVNSIKMRSSSDADALRPGGAADYVQTQRDSQSLAGAASIFTSSGPSHTSTPALSQPVAGSLPSRSASTSSVASPTISQADDADDASAHVAMPRRATAFAPRAVVITAQATEGKEREMTLEEEEDYLMAMMEGDATGVARARRNTVITKREPGAVEEGRRRHQRRDFKVTHVEFPEEGSYGRGFHEDVDLAFVAKGDELKDYVWGVGGASALDSSEEEEEVQEEGGGEEGEEGDGQEEVEEEDASLEELQGSDPIETEAEEEEEDETPPDDLVAAEEDGVEEEKDEKAEGGVESKEKQRRPEGQGAARGKRKRKVTGDESGTSAETRTELQERAMAQNETEEATGPLQ